MADRLENTASKQDAVEQAPARLEDVSRIHASDIRYDSAGTLHTFVPLSPRMASLTHSTRTSGAACPADVIN